MATFSISAVARKAQATANGSTTQFAFSFSVNTEADVAVFVGTTLKTISTHYTVSITSSTGAGSITFTSGNTPTNGQIVTIMSKTALARSSVYTSGGTINATSLETDFDTNMMLFQQQDERLDRVITAPVDDATSIDMTLPNKDARKGTVLGFNATSGNPEAGPSITAVQSLADVTTAINLLGTSDAVADMNTLGTSAVVEDMNLLGTSANVTAMGLLGTSAAVADMAILGTSDVVADMAILATTDVVADMNTLATSDIISDLNTLATSDIVTDMNLLATSSNVAAMALLGTSDVVADMALLGTSDVVADLAILGTTDVVSDMNTLATSDIVSDMNTLATSANVTAMGLLGTSAVVEDMGFLGTAAVVEDLGILGTSANVTALSNVSGSISNVNTVASNLSGVNDFAARYRVGSSDPSSNNDDGDLFYNTSSDTLKIYNAGSSAWEAGATLGSGFLPLSGGQLSGNLTMAGSQTVDGRDVSADGTKLDTLATVGTTSITTLGTIGTGVWQGTAIASAYIAGDAITGAKIADNAINSEHYTDGSIDTAHIADSQITVAKMAANSIDSAQYVDGSIDTAHIADGQITADKLGADSVTAAKIGDNVLNSEHYAAGSIDAEHLASDSVTEAKIAANSIDSQAYVDGSIDQVHLANAIVNEAKMQISNSPVNGYMLTAQSGNTGGLTWAAAGGGGMEFIASSGAISDGTASVSFTQFDASKYDHYQFFFQYLIPATDDVGLLAHASTDGGSNYDTTNANYHIADQSNRTGFLIVPDGHIGSAANEFGVSGEATLFAPHLTTYTYMKSSPIFMHVGSAGRIDGTNEHVSVKLAAADVDAIQFKFTSGNIESGEITMFGIVNS